MFSNITKNIIKLLSDFLISLYKFAAFNFTYLLYCILQISYICVSQFINRLKQKSLTGLILRSNLLGIFTNYRLSSLFTLRSLVNIELLIIFLENDFLIRKKHRILWKKRFIMGERNQYLSKLLSAKIMIFQNSLLALENVVKLILLPKRD